MRDKGTFTPCDMSRSGATVSRVAAQLQFETVLGRPPRSLRSRLPLTRGRLTPPTWELYSPPPSGGEPPKAAGGRSHIILNSSWATRPKAVGWNFWQTSRRAAEDSFAALRLIWAWQWTTAFSRGYLLSPLRGCAPVPRFLHSF